MNRVLFFGLIVVLASMLGACCSTRPVHCGSATDTICIPLKSGDQGRDVRNWQCFLLEKGFSVILPTGTFDKETEEATRRFQNSWCYGGSQHIAITGTVTFATYWKAVRAGMPQYKLLPAVECSAASKRSGRRHVHRDNSHHAYEQILTVIGSHENFYTVMKWECKDAPTHPQEVMDWQAMISKLGYSGSWTAGDFDTATQGATANFQSDFGLKGLPHVNSGQVDYAQTFCTAKKYCGYIGVTINVINVIRDTAIGCDSLGTH